MKTHDEETNVRISTGGSIGLGDPDDMKLRRVERDILIKNKVRDAAKLKCRDVILKFGECAKESGLMMPFACRSQNAEQIACLSKWFHDEELNEQMKQEYLKQRSEYRKTGVPSQNKLRWTDDKI